MCLVEGGCGVDECFGRPFRLCVRCFHLANAGGLRLCHLTAVNGNIRNALGEQCTFTDVLVKDTH